LFHVYKIYRALYTYNQDLSKLRHVIIICALFMRALISAKYDCNFGLKKLTNLIENDCWCWYRDQGLRYFCIFTYIFRDFAARGQEQRVRHYRRRVCRIKS